MYFRSAQKRLSGVFSTPFFFLTQPVHSRRQEHIRVRRALGKPAHTWRASFSTPTCGSEFSQSESAPTVTYVLLPPA